MLLRKHNFVNSVLSLLQKTHDHVKLKIVGYKTFCCLLEIEDFLMPPALLSREVIQIVNQDFQTGHFELISVIGQYICKLLSSARLDLSKDIIEMVMFFLIP